MSRVRLVVAVLAASLTLTGCGSSSSEPDAAGAGGAAGAAGSAGAARTAPLPWSKSAVPARPQDDVLHVNHVQAKGTHNSYHVETPGNNQPEWHYSMPPLDQQLGELGMRQIELDLHLKSLDDEIEIHHLTLIDQGTTCKTLRECLTVIGTWSGAHPGHHPLYIQLEPKSGLGTFDPEAYFAKLESEILSVLVRDRIITPDEVQGSAATLGEGVAKNGWPTLRTTRGRMLFAFNDAEAVRAAYTRGGTSLKGRLLFTESQPGDPLAAIAILNNPTDKTIPKALAANMLVRTMSDGATDGDAAAQAGLDAAIAAGATWISTDVPAPVPGRTYVQTLPGGTPSRCNPITAPPSCTADDVEKL